MKTVFYNLFIFSDVKESDVSKNSALEKLDMTDNPLSQASYEFLKGVKSCTIHLSAPEEHEWDDL